MTPISTPHPDPYLAAIESLGLAAPMTVAIEDSLAGIAAAHAAGISAIALSTAQTLAALSDSVAALVVSDLAEPALYEYLNQRFMMS